MKLLVMIAALSTIPLAASAGEISDGSTVNWAGFYAGVHAGAARNNHKTDYDYSYLPGNGTGNFSDAFGNAADNAAASASNGPLNVGGANAVDSALAQGIIPSSLGSSNDTDFAGGVQAGFNYQQGAWVLGPEIDFTYIDGKSTSTHTTVIPAAYTNTGSSSSSIDWLSTARLRAGYSFDRALLYATGGLALGDVKSESTSVGTDGITTDTFYGSKSETRVGWAIGGGVDYALSTNWSLRAEGLYYDLGKVSYDVAAQDLASASEGLTTHATQKFDGSVFRVGLNYRL